MWPHRPIPQAAMFGRAISAASAACFLHPVHLLAYMNLYNNCFFSTMDHATTVQQISERVADFHRRQQPFRIYHGSTNSTRPANHSASTTVSTAGLTRVLEIDVERCTAVVEPNVPMDDLVATTRQQGLVPLVVMEFPGITVGGGFSGTSGESSSFREGFFDHTVNWVEMVLADGQVVKAFNDRILSNDHVQEKRSDLFWGAASSFGTMGVVTLLEVRLKKADPLVELKYYVSSDMKDALRIFQQASADPQTEYLDGIVYAHNKIVVCAGRQVENISATNSTVQRFTRRADKWFYLHVEKIAKSFSSSQNNISTPAAVDYIPLTDYLFRYDRGGFWVARYAYSYFLTPFNFITRWILDRFMHTRVMYHALHVSGLSRFYIIQDIGVPVSTAAEFLDWLDRPENFGEYPLWLCPLPPGSAGGLEGQAVKDFDNEDADRTTLMNFGIWGPSNAKGQDDFMRKNRQIEHKVHSLGGKKWLYAHTYYTESEFWDIYNKDRYDSLREKYHAQHLPTLYDKVRVRESDLPGAHRGNFESGWKGMVKRALWDVWPFSGLYGVYKAWRGGDYLLQKEASSKKIE
ncbi:hypothetical protein N7532_003513 [Penicillium argentinense]|uniref:Delta(24)-sterol reductase n=1 Tax=Penicillium argentinense TaxID=1131581 RepID=A0A9W9FMJ5_9EURO|nr:uncharacterized protein N7532_003513 [Penicillium argentinense]KAJ5102984.1 hypothetical protein N7532_003513 [Penicillium argentinense]